MSGNNPKIVRKFLTKAHWMKRGIIVTKINGINKKIETISKELKRLPTKYQKYLTPIGGTFKWRKIAGTNRLSVHSFGAAIDINVNILHIGDGVKGKNYPFIPK